MRHRIPHTAPPAWGAALIHGSRALGLLLATCLWAACDLAHEPKASARDSLPGLEQAEDVAKAHPSFSKYFYLGKAELNRYELVQSRYGDTHPGDAVLIFVTEDFLRDEQVKYEGHGSRKNVVNVLKLNAYRHFYTGIYPYTVMTSVFMPAQGDEGALKLSFSASEWCGHVYTQLNRRADGFHVDEHSYFQQEADQTRQLPVTRLEDELLLQIRRNPSALPTGAIDVLPSVLYARLHHQAWSASRAVATLSEEKGGMRTYTLRYERGREVAFTFEAAFPHRIVQFREAIPGQPQTTAKLTRSIMLPYWEKHGAGDAAYREALGLSIVPR